MTEDPPNGPGHGTSSSDDSGQSLDWCVLGHKALAVLWIFSGLCNLASMGRAGMVLCAMVLSGAQSGLCNNLGCGTV